MFSILHFVVIGLVTLTYLLQLALPQLLAETLSIKILVNFQKFINYLDIYDLAIAGGTIPTSRKPPKGKPTVTVTETIANISLISV